MLLGGFFCVDVDDKKFCVLNWFNSLYKLTKVLLFYKNAIKIIL